MVRVVETCRLVDGLTIKKLSHYKCGSCGSRFFDDDAMRVIQAARASPLTRRSVLIPEN